MSNLNISNATSSNFVGTEEDYMYSVTPISTDGVSGEGETSWTVKDANKWFGYFNTIPDLKATLLLKSVWVVGKGYTADPETTVILDYIKGFGKDTFKDILFNLDVSRRIYGDSFAEIIRDKETGTLINLKPLDPSSIKVWVDKNGIITRYEQIAKLPNQKNINFKPDEILHLVNNRIADNIHGISDVLAMEDTIKADQELFENTVKVMRRQAKPMIMFKLGTDDPAKIQAFISKMDTATNKGENIYIPDDENSVTFEVVQVDTGSLILQHAQALTNKFYRTQGLPQVLPTGGGSTESGGKIGYLAFEQIIEHEQKYIEEQIKAQLNLAINLYPPATLSQDLQNDQAKDGTNAFQPSDTTAGVGR